MMSTQENSNQDEKIVKAVTVLSETFEPAGTADESAKRYTSQQLASAIYELTGAVVDIETLYEIMAEYGYRYVVDESSAGMKYVWLLKYRNR